MFNTFWAFRNDALRDFGSFIAAGRAATAGRDPYGAEEPLVFVVSIPQLDWEIPAPNLNPPISVPLFQLLDHLEPVQAIQTWRGISFVFYFLAIALLAWYYHQSGSFLRIVWAIALAGWWHTIEVGQIYAPLVLATVGAWLLLRSGHRISAGLLIGILVAFKPQFAIWPLFLLVTGFWQTFLASAITAAILWLLPLLAYGPGIYLQWLAASSQFQGYALPNFSLAGLSIRFGSLSLGIAVGVLLIAILLYTVVRSKCPLETVSTLALLATLLVSPITWSGYTLVLLPAFFVKNWSWPTRIAGILLAVPFAFVVSAFSGSRVAFIVFGWFYGWALLALLADMLISTRVPAEPTEHASPLRADA